MKMLLLAGCVGLISLTTATAQDAAVSVPFDGTEAFGRILHSFGLKPIPRLENLDQFAPEKTLVVIFGDLTALDKLRTWRERGAFLIASDYAASVPAPWQLTIQGNAVYASADSNYRKNWPNCPVVRGFQELAHPLFKGLQQGLATNRPSFLRGAKSDLRRLVTFADDCFWLDRGEIQRNVPAGAGYIFGSPKDAPPAGRAVVLAGQGVFLNGMLIQPDNDNFAFAWNTIGWLAEAPGGPREYALFIDHGKVVDDFALPLRTVGPIPIPPIQVINHLIRGLEDENIFNRFLTANLDKSRILRGLLILSSLVLLALAGRWLLLGRFRLDSGVPLIVGKQPTTPPALPVLWQRQEELRRQGNLWEPAQVLARQFFLDHGGLSVPLWDTESAAPPSWEVGGNTWQRRRLRRQVRRLWNLARSSPAHQVSSRQFDDLLRIIAETSAAATAGRLQFAPAPLSPVLSNTIIS